VRHPAAGSRLIEGEPFTVNALISDNRSIDFAEIYVELNGSIVSSTVFLADEAAKINASGDYFQAQLRVPNRPEGGRVVVGIRARDDAGLITDLPLDLVILDDNESPLINVRDPDQHLSLYPGDAFSVKGVASDNIYIHSVSAFLIRGGEELELDWEVFTRNDRLEQIRVDNTDSFGSVVAAERFYVDYEGRIRLPENLIDRAGEEFEFVVRVRDNGILHGESNRIGITILADDQKPSIEFIEPETTLYDRQSPNFKLLIKDNVQLDSYRVSVIDSETREVLSEDNLETRSVEVIEQDIIDLARYSPLPEKGATFTVAVTASDNSGNTETASQLFTVLPDQAPNLELVKAIPASNLVRGQTLFARVRVTDEYIVEGLNRYYELYSSLIGLESDRDLQYDVQVVNDHRRLRWMFDYPEWQGYTGRLKVNDFNYWEFDNSNSHVFARFIDSVRSLKLELDGYSVDYTVEVFSDDLCQIEHQVFDVSADELAAEDGTLLLAPYLGKGVTHITVTPKILGQHDGSIALKKIRIAKNELANSLSFDDDGVDRFVETFEVLSLLVDDEQAQGNVGIISSTPGQSVSETEVILDRFYPSPAEVGIERIVQFGAATDRFSLERGALPANNLGVYSLSVDEFDPRLEIVSPADGTDIVPGEKIEVRLRTTDNSGAIDSITLLDNGNFVAERGGRYQFGSDYIFHYAAPQTRLAGETNLSFVVRDKSQRSASRGISLPVAVNESPLLNFASFSSYKVGGSYRKVISDPGRINYGEFWVRVGEQFKLASNLTDDSGIVSYTINRLNRDGSIFTEYQRLYESTCPALPLKSAPNEVAEIVFNQSEPTEYEVIVEDNVGNTTIRRFLVHPLANVAPEIRITKPAVGQFIVAGTFQVEIGLLAADDRQLPVSSIKLFANGIPISTSSDDSALSGVEEAAIKNGINSIYDALEEKYSIEIPYNKTLYALIKSMEQHLPKNIL
jgi:hypothetical protein